MSEQFFLEILKGIILLVGGSLSLKFFVLAILVSRAPKHEWEANRQALNSAKAGILPRYLSGDQCYRIKTGLAMNTKINTCVRTVTISEYGIECALGFRRNAIGE